MFERPRSGERAVLVNLALATEEVQEDLREFEELAKSAAATVVATITGSRHRPEPRFFVGRGKLEEIRAAVAEQTGQLVLFNHTLTPGQERNLERELQCRVLDRTGLILDIFAQRAQSFEGKLQVELAQLQHLSTRLVRGWTHLERQKGGIGLRGPGETQLETDRRLIGLRIKQLKRKLTKVRGQRTMGARARRRAAAPTVSLVGYTNAGKSTLFQALTGSAVYTADQLFATLDPTLRRMTVPGIPELVLADTVGFIRRLPHDLVEAFRSTLEETSDADLLLHVVDANDPQRDTYIQQVDQVLAQIGADAVPQIHVYNKIDLRGHAPQVDRDAQGRVQRVWVSAATGAGLDELRAAMGECLGAGRRGGRVRLGPQAARWRAKLYAWGAVQHEQVLENGDCLIDVWLDAGQWQALQAEVPVIELQPESEEYLARPA